MKTCEVQHREWIRPATRRATLDRDEICVYCEVLPSSVIDHAMPVAAGGTSDPTNLVGACWYCNDAKGALAADERFRFERRQFGQMWLHLTPILRRTWADAAGFPREGIDLPTRTPLPLC